MSAKNTNLVVQIPEDLDRELKETARKNLLSKSAFVRTALLDAVRRQTVIERPDEIETDQRKEPTK